SSDNGLGTGWTLSGGDNTASPPATLIDHSLLPSSSPDYYDMAEVVWPDGGSSFYGHIAGSNVYLSPAGDSTELKHNGDGSWTLTDQTGSVYSFNAIASGASST